MARHIKPTPILTGEDAERFLWNMAHPKPLPKEEVEKDRELYEIVKANNPDCELFR